MSPNDENWKEKRRVGAKYSVSRRRNALKYRRENVKVELDPSCPQRNSLCRRPTYTLSTTIPLLEERICKYKVGDLDFIRFLGSLTAKSQSEITRKHPFQINMLASSWDNYVYSFVLLDPWCRRSLGISSYVVLTNRDRKKSRDAELVVRAAFGRVVSAQCAAALWQAERVLGRKGKPLMGRR
ncbi:hypothetical protein TNIN_347321 [Trichonephila inaurata madagascariensis]|uniref:Uncharacterized protein n=1 Tax=Trichonephila inaurata madagascariensis TaxID=2747483 RepID=A0A8X6JC36_9ARAC|nr:hypothetical protein TNIN_347321 [Trichonephila inaurata madagascariensis]